MVEPSCRDRGTMSQQSHPQLESLRVGEARASVPPPRCDDDRVANEDVAVLVPVYNEARVVADVVAELVGRFGHVVCVDDGSTDGSDAAARAAGATVLRHATNLGQGAALQTAIEHALTLPDVSYLVTFDADGQHQVG